MAGAEAVLVSWAERMSVPALAGRLVAEIDGEIVAIDHGWVWTVEHALWACPWRGGRSLVSRARAAPHRRPGMPAVGDWRSGGPGCSTATTDPAGELPIIRSG